MGIVRIEWSQDRELAHKIVTDESVWPWIVYDSIDKEDFVFPDIDGVKLRVGVCYDGDVMGCFLFIEKEEKITEIHTCMLPIAKGKAKSFGDLVLEKVFSETNYDEVHTFIAEDNPLAKRLAQKCGFVKLADIEPLTKNGIKISAETWGVKKCQQFRP